jgi:uncharacterized protein (TIGR00255 family)
MTGWGKSSCEADHRKISIEIRSLNSKQLDLSVKVPQLYKEKELEIRQLLNEKLQRGKVDLIMQAETTIQPQIATINKELLKDYFMQIKALGEEIGVPVSDSLLPMLLRMPDVLATGEEHPGESEWKHVKEAIGKAVDGLLEYRANEGKVLEKDICARLQLISDLLVEVEAFEKTRMGKIRDRIQANLAEFVGVDKVDSNRFEQELIYYLEKIDITEEKVRLRNHCNYFFEVCAESEAVGKKLGFVSQEIGREINTIGSKANDADIQRLVVRMKDELEKIKEQLMNIL